MIAEKTIQANIILYDYLKRIYDRKRQSDFKQLLNVYNELQRLDTENVNLRHLINERDTQLYKYSRENTAYKLQHTKDQEKIHAYESQIAEMQQVIERMSEGMIARCDICGSED